MFIAYCRPKLIPIIYKNADHKSYENNFFMRTGHGTDIMNVC